MNDYCGRGTGINPRQLKFLFGKAYFFVFRNGTVVCESGTMLYDVRTYVRTAFEGPCVVFFPARFYFWGTAEWVRCAFVVGEGKGRRSHPESVVLLESVFFFMCCVLDGVGGGEDIVMIGLCSCIYSLGGNRCTGELCLRFVVFEVFIVYIVSPRRSDNM